MPTYYLAQRGDAICLASFMTQMELMYRVWRDEGEAAGRLALEQCLAMPIVWVQAEQPLLEKAAEIKATHRVSVVDAWIAATAILRGATLVHKDPEMEPVACPQLLLPYKQADSPQTADAG